MPQKSLEDYEVLNVKEFGSFGTCYKVRDKASGGLFILKAVEYESLSGTKKQMLLNNLKSLSNHQHPFILHFIDYFIHPVSGTIYIVMEWCSGGSLASLVEEYKKKGEYLKEDFIWKTLFQIGQAVNFYCSKIIDFPDLHRQIISSNIFLDANGNAKLGDYQISQLLELKRLDSDFPIDLSLFGTSDIFKNQKLEKKSDVSALGCLILELATSFAAPSGSQCLDTNLDGSTLLPDVYSNDLRNMLNFMLRNTGNAPSSVKTILQHPSIVRRVSCAWSGENFNKVFKENCSIHRHKQGFFSNSKKSQSLKFKNLSPDISSENTSERTFHEKWLNRIESIRKKEAELKIKEERMIEFERNLTKKEKQTEILEKLAKEKVRRAELYLKQCKEFRITRKVRKVAFSPSRHNYKNDTSFSADPGDSSLLMTTAKVRPKKICKIKSFDEVRLNKSNRHVTFDKPLSEKVITGCVADSEDKENDSLAVKFVKESVKVQHPLRMSKPGLNISLSLAALTNRNRSKSETVAFKTKVSQPIPPKLPGLTFLPKPSSVKGFSKKGACNKHTSL